MKLFTCNSIEQIPANDSHVFAFRISGRISDDDAEAMAKFMNNAFDHADSVNMLMIFDDFQGSDWDAMLDGDVATSRFRALSKVDKYAVVGAPESAAAMINAMDWIIPVDAKTFKLSELDLAWSFVGSKPATNIQAAE